MSISIYVDGSLKGTSIYSRDYICADNYTPHVTPVTNNESEIIAFIRCLEWIGKYYTTGIFCVKSDSALLVKSFYGKPIQIKNTKVMVTKPELITLLERAKNLHNELSLKGYRVKLKWIPRSVNKIADKLSRGEV